MVMVVVVAVVVVMVVAVMTIEVKACLFFTSVDNLESHGRLIFFVDTFDIKYLRSARLRLN